MEPASAPDDKWHRPALPQEPPVPPTPVLRRGVYFIARPGGSFPQAASNAQKPSRSLSPEAMQLTQHPYARDGRTSGHASTTNSLRRGRATIPQPPNPPLLDGADRQNPALCGVLFCRSIRMCAKSPARSALALVRPGTQPRTPKIGKFNTSAPNPLGAAHMPRLYRIFPVPRRQ
jgi:hypothetical protein